MKINLHVLISLLGVFIAAVSQLFLKKSANQKHDTLIKEYVNRYVLIGYSLMLLSTLLGLIAYKGIPISLGMVLETTSYIYVFLFDIIIFKKNMRYQELLGLGFIIIGIFLFAY